MVSSFSELDHLKAEEKSVSFMTEFFDEKYHKYNSHLTLVVDIISNWVKHLYHSKQNLNYSIGEINNSYDYIPCKNVINQITLIHLYDSNRNCDHHVAYWENRF